MLPLLLTAGTIFAAELGDKTLFTVLLLATRRPALPVALGAAVAFLIQSLLAVAAGRLLALLPARAVRLGGALLFALFGLLALLRREEETTSDRSSSRASPFIEALWLVFVAELGDATEIATAALAARFRAPVRVFVGAVAGLWAGTVVAIVAGRLLGRHVPAARLRLVSGVVFLALAAWTAIGLRR